MSHTLADISLNHAAIGYHVFHQDSMNRSQTFLDFTPSLIHNLFYYPYMRVIGVRCRESKCCSFGWPCWLRFLDKLLIFPDSRTARWNNLVPGTYESTMEGNQNGEALL